MVSAIATQPVSKFRRPPKDWLDPAVVDCGLDDDWLIRGLESIRIFGYAIVTGLLDGRQTAEIRAAMYRVQKLIEHDVGRDRLQRAGEIGTLRLMARYDPLFLSLIELPEVLAIVDRTVGETAVLHLQNGLILPSFPPGEAPKVFQNRFHMDFPRVMNGFPCSINTLIAVDAFTARNGATLVVPGTHQRGERPPDEYMQSHAVAVECPAGSMIVFDSTLWHAAGTNLSGEDRVGINQQFTRSYFKQQIDLVRALGADLAQKQKPRVQQLLGWYTRVPTSLDEFYRPAEERLYRAGQG